MVYIQLIIHINENYVLVNSLFPTLSKHEIVLYHFGIYSLLVHRPNFSRYFSKNPPALST